jgi:hypothetical protein
MMLTHLTIAVKDQEGWGFAADLTDPDGNHFTIHETRKPSANADWAKTAKKA